MADIQTNISSKELKKKVESLQLKHPIAEIVKATGYSKGTVSSYINGDKQPSLAFIKEFENSFNVSLRDSKPLIKQNSIPLIPIDAMAGFGVGEYQIMEHESESYVIPAFKEAEFLISVKGSSMYPKYNSGDIVACKKLALNDLFFQWNKVYVLDTKQGALIKRIKKGALEDSIQLVSDNESYDPFELKLNQINSVALVIGVIRLE